MEINVGEVYTREEAEAILKISQSTMIRLIKKGTIRAAKIGGQYRILGVELLRQFLPQGGYETARTFYRTAREKVHSLEAELETEKSRNVRGSPARRKQC